MQLDPATYLCPTHGIDLTPLVRVALEEREIVIYGRKKREFAVPVSCPGGTPPDGAHPDGAHPQVCRGRFSR